MLPLNRETLQAPHYPVRILQFGEGNFMRAFFDWMIEKSNQAGITQLGIAVCQPRSTTSSELVRLLQAQEGCYHVCLTDQQASVAVTRIEPIRVIEEAFNPVESYSQYEACFLSPHLQIVVSNTTEAGISYQEGEDLFATPPRSFPGKVTAMLYRRFCHFKGDNGKGLAFLCCELIEDNSTKLYQYVLRHAREARLGEDFEKWVQQACLFCDTLVDRIVTGYPAGSAAEITQRIGVEDALLLQAEAYHLFVIGGSDYKRMQALLPLDKAGLNVHFVPSVAPFRNQKVRILNGIHTALVPIAWSMGYETVAQALADPLLKTYVEGLVGKEILPVVEGDSEALQAYAEGILNRLRNPFVEHRLQSIALNSIAKWQTRNYPTWHDQWKKHQQIASYTTFSLAALLHLYGEERAFTPNDSLPQIQQIRAAFQEKTREQTAEKIIRDRTLWQFEPDEIEPLIPVLGQMLRHIETEGMKRSLGNLIQEIA